MKYMYEASVLKEGSVVIGAPESAPDILADFETAGKKSVASKVSEITQADFTVELSYMDFKDKVTSWANVKYCSRPDLYRLFLDSETAL